MPHERAQLYSVSKQPTTRGAKIIRRRKIKIVLSILTPRLAFDARAAALLGVIYRFSTAHRLGATNVGCVRAD